MDATTAGATQSHPQRCTRPVSGEGSCAPAPTAESRDQMRKNPCQGAPSEERMGWPDAEAFPMRSHFWQSNVWNLHVLHLYYKYTFVLLCFWKSKSTQKCTYSMSAYLCTLSVLKKGGTTPPRKWLFAAPRVNKAVSVQSVNNWSCLAWDANCRALMVSNCS